MPLPRGAVAGVLFFSRRVRFSTATPAQARDLWHTLEPADEAAALGVDALLRGLPPLPAASPRSPDQGDGDDKGGGAAANLAPPPCLEPRPLRDALAQLPDAIRTRPLAVDDLMMYLLARATDDIHDCRKKLCHAAFDRPAEYDSVMPYDSFVHKSTQPPAAS